MFRLLALLLPVYSQGDLYRSQPWVPGSLSPGEADFVDNDRPGHSPTMAPGYTPYPPYSHYAISGKPISVPLHHNSVDDQESVETHSFIFLAPPPNSSASLAATLSPVLRVHSQGDRQPYSREGDRRLDQVSMETQKVSAAKQREEVRPRQAQRRGKKPNPFLEKRRPYSKGARKTVQEKSKQGGTRSLVPPRPQKGLAPARRKPLKRSRAVDSARRRVGSEADEPTTLVNFGDWAAQWDELEEAWYFYNYYTGESTWNRPAELKDVPFDNPYKATDAGSGGKTNSQIPPPTLAEQTANPVEEMPEGDITSYSPPVTEQFKLPGASANKSSAPSQLRQGNLANHQLTHLKPDAIIAKANAGKPVTDRKKKKYQAAVGQKTLGFKYLLPEKKPKVRKDAKAEKEYGWFDFLSLPKFGLPDLFGFNSKSKSAERPVRKAPRAHNAEPLGRPEPGPQAVHPSQQQAGQDLRRKRKIHHKQQQSPGQRGCYTWIHSILRLC